MTYDTIAFWAACISFAAWFVVSVAAQFSDRVGMLLPRLSSLGLIPCWTFFAPRPGIDDIHLLYRDRFGHEDFRTLRYFQSIEDRRWYHFIWNPRKYHTKVLYDLTSSLRSQIRFLREKKHDPRAIMLSTPYIMILHLVMRMPRSSEATGRQFILARTTSSRMGPERAIIFLSDVHSFDEAERGPEVRA